MATLVRSRRSALLALLVLALALSIPAGAGAAPASAPRAAGGEINVGIWQEPDFLTWIVGNSCFNCVSIMQALWEPPLRVAPDGSLIPILLTDVPSTGNGGISADGKTITINLKPGLKWSDGQPLTVHDFVFTWKLVMDPNTGAILTQGWDQIDSVDTPSDTQAVIHLKAPFAPFLSLVLAGHYGTWMPEHALQGQDFKAWSREPKVTSGPFMLSEWVSGDHVTVVKNPNYMQPAQLDQITFKLVTDRSAMLAQLKSGDLDAGLQLNEPDIVVMKEVPGVTVYPVPGSNIEMWHLNERMPGDLTKPHPILTDLKVRQAIYYALDRQALVQSVLAGIPAVAVNWLDGTAFFNQNLKPWPHDLDKANQLLDQAGWVKGVDGIRAKNGMRLHLTYSTTSGNQVREQIQVVLQQQLQQAGIELEIKNYRPAQLFASFSENGIVTTGNYDIAEYADSIIGPDPDISRFYLTSQITSPSNQGGQNWIGVSNPDLDKALTCELQSFDVSVRKQCLDQAQQIIYDNVYDIFLYDKTDILIASAKLKGIQHQADPVAMWLGNVEEWHLEE